MGIAAPFSPSLPGLPGLMPITDQAVARLRERIASVEDRDAVTASALWTVEEVLGPAGFVSRRGEDLVVHRAGKHFRAVFGPGDLVLPGGKETRVEQAFLSGEPEVVPAEGFPLAAVGHRSIPPRLVMIPVSIRGKVAGVVIAFTEKATEVAMAEISRYRQIADVVSERLLVFLVKKKARQSLPP
jgi:hypothetical protein